MPFEWYWQENFLPIASQRATPRPNGHRPICLGEQEIQCQGQYLVIFQYQKSREQLLLVTSLNLTGCEQLRNQLKKDQLRSFR